MPGHLQEGFGCVVTNRFDQLFDDEEDPFELLKQAEAKKKDAPAPGAAKSAANAAKQPKKESQKDRRAPLPDKKDETTAPVPLKKEGMRRMGRRPEQQAQQGSQQPPQQQQQQQQQQAPPQQQHQQGGHQGEGRPQADRRPDRRPPRERRSDKPAEDKPAEGGEFSVEKSIGDRPFRGRGGARGGRGGRGRGIGRTDGFDSRGKREFDRHSGSDRSLKAEEKRGGSGSHNWGTVKDELSELDQSNVTEDNHEGEEHPPADSENKENEVEEAKEEEPKEMTLDEWKAQQDKERAKVEFNLRKANDGTDWKKGFLLHKSKAKDAGADDDDPAGDHHFRKPANDITSQLEINFGDLGRPGRGRGGPRGGRGGRGGGGGNTRPPRERRPDKVGGGSAPNVDDPEAFPALA